MPNKMLIDATHPEETRVVVLRGNRVEEFDFESANRKQLRGNIYLAKVTRVEPSLQAAFVDYGGNRHGFLAFSEIHPDYYQIPVADRQALIAEDERAQRAAEAEADHRAGRRHARRERASDRGRDEVKSEPVESAQAESTADRGRTVRERRRGHDGGVRADGATGRFGRGADVRRGPAGRDHQRNDCGRAPGGCVAHDHRRGSTDRARRARDEQRVRAGPDRRRGIQFGRDPRRRNGRHLRAGEKRRRFARHRRRPQHHRGQRPRRRGRRRDRGIGRRRRRDGGSARAHAAAASAIQDSRGHQAPAGDAGAGGQGGARHQGRGAHHLSFARRPLFGADAEHRARRRHQPQDHQRGRSQTPEGNRPGAGSAGRHGRDPAHRRRRPHQDRGQARLRISASDVGDGARPHAQVDRAHARLRGRIAGQALDPRPLQQGHRGNPGRRRRRLQGSQRFHAHAHAEPCQEREILPRQPADLHASRHREPARRHVHSR